MIRFRHEFVVICENPSTNESNNISDIENLFKKFQKNYLPFDKKMCLSIIVFVY